MKQKLTALLLVLCMVMAFVPAMAVASAAENTGTTGVTGTTDTWDWSADKTAEELFVQPTKGTGTAQDPILIESAAQFMWFRNKLTDETGLTLCYKLMVNIHFKSPAEIATDKATQNAYRSALGAPATVTYTTEGRNDVFTYKPFSGVFDGNGKVIDGFCPAASRYQGMFGAVSGTIKNLTVDGFTTDEANYFGGIAEELSGTALIVNCKVYNINAHAGYAAGGIVGRVSSATSYQVKIQDCETSTAEGTNLYARMASAGCAGIVGQFYVQTFDCTLTVQNCTNKCNIGGSESPINNSSAGGIIGSVEATAPEYKDPATKKNTGNRMVATIKDCVNEGKLVAQGDTNTSAAGMIGKAKNCPTIKIERCINRGAIQSVNGAAGGLLGEQTSSSARSVTVTITDSSNQGSVTAGTAAGGLLVGTSMGYTKRNGDWIKNDDGTPAAGTNIPVLNATITRCSQTGDVTAVCDNPTDAVSQSNAGGIIARVAHNQYNSFTFTVNSCYLNASVSAATAAVSNAGLVCGMYATQHAKSKMSVNGSLLIGTVTTGTGAGAVTGYADSATITVVNSYFSVTNSGLTLAGAGTAATTEVVANADFTGTTVLDALNAAAVTAGLPADTWVQGAKTPELKLFYVAPDAPAITIDGASLTIGENVTLNLFVKTETIRNAGVTVKTISIVNNAGDPAVNGVLRGTNYVFTIEGLSAKEFGTNKIYHVQYTTADAPGTPIDCTATKEYSPLQYAINMYGKTDKAGLDALLLSIVNYADAAAGTTTAKAAFDEKHADADWTALTALTEIVKEDKDSGSYSYDAKTMPGISATLTNAIELKVVPNETYTDVTVKVGEEIIEKNGNGAYAFYATDLYNEITFTFTGAEGTEPLRATTSLVQFLNAYAGTDYEAQATATAQYLYAARLFCLNNQPNA